MVPFNSNSFMASHSRHLPIKQYWSLNFHARLLSWIPWFLNSHRSKVAPLWTISHLQAPTKLTVSGPSRTGVSGASSCMASFCSTGRVPNGHSMLLHLGRREMTGRARLCLTRTVYCTSRSYTQRPLWGWQLLFICFPHHSHFFSHVPRVLSCQLGQRPTAAPASHQYTPESKVQLGQRSVSESSWGDY